MEKIFSKHGTTLAIIVYRSQQQTVGAMSTKILTENVLTSFADLVSANRRRLYRLWLIAPWIGSTGQGDDSVTRIAEALNGSHCRVILITRRPTAVWHDQAIRVLARHPHREFFLCESLHTKLYILECNGFRSAIFGSPNLTPAADYRNRELAIEFRTTIQGRTESTAALVSELISYASTLRGQDDVRPME